MNLSEVSKILGINREALRDIINNGILLGSTLVKLEAEPVGRDFHISDEQFDAFQAACEGHQPGRNTPIAVIRQLRVESNMRCGICTVDSFLEYHHIIEYSQVKHYDPNNMLAVCPNCHAKINAGEIDHRQQRLHKEKLNTMLGHQIVEIFGGRSPIVIKWEDIGEVISAIDEEWDYDGDDYISNNPNLPMRIDKKNILNNMDSAYFAMIRDRHEPYFEKIREFLSNPANRKVKRQYLGLMEDLRQISLHSKAHRTGIHEFMTQLYGRVAEMPSMSTCKPLIAILISFMYMNCDLGIKENDQAG